MIKNSHYAILAILLVGCTKPAQRDIRQAVINNKNAKTILEWEASSEHPTVLFENFRIEHKENDERGKEVCVGLDTLQGEELTIFEKEINNPENAEMLNPCLDQLTTKLEDYWEEQKVTLPEAPKAGFKFQTRFEKRDLSKGYRARTGDVNPKELVLTFDDGPDREMTTKLLKILKDVDAKVMFFPLGKQVKANPDVIYKAAKDGHSIGSHSNTHSCLGDNATCARSNKSGALTAEQAIAEIRKGHQEVYNVLGFVDPFFRFPYGESDPKLKQYLADRQVAQMYWSIDSTDWKMQSNEELLTKVLEEVEKEQRGIVLFHDIHRRTIEIMPAFLKALYDRGYSLVVLEAQDENARYNSQLVTKKPVLP